MKAVKVHNIVQEGLSAAFPRPAWVFPFITDLFTRTVEGLKGWKSESSILHWSPSKDFMMLSVQG